MDVTTAAVDFVGYTCIEVLYCDSVSSSQFTLSRCIVKNAVACSARTQVPDASARLTNPHDDHVQDETQAARMRNT